MFNHTGFDPYVIGERNRQIFEELRALRLEERLRKGRKGSEPHPGAFDHYLKGALHLLGRTGLAGR